MGKRNKDVPLERQMLLILKNYDKLSLENAELSRKNAELSQKLVKEGNVRKDFERQIECLRTKNDKLKQVVTKTVERLRVKNARLEELEKYQKALQNRIQLQEERFREQEAWFEIYNASEDR